MTHAIHKYQSLQRIDTCARPFVCIYVIPSWERDTENAL